MSFMRKDRVLEYRVGEIRVKGDVGQALHSENVFFFLCKRQKLYTKKDLTPILRFCRFCDPDFADFASYLS